MTPTGESDVDPWAVVGLDGPAVVVPGRLAYRLAPILVRALRAARDEGRRIDADIVGVVRALEHAGRVYAAGRLASGTYGIPVDDPSGRVNRMSTKDVAVAIGCTERNVRALAERGSLEGHRERTGWSFDAVAVREFIDRRSTEETQ